MKLSKQCSRLATWAAAVMLLVAGSARAEAPATQPARRLFWKVTSPTTEGWFMGAIHMGKPGMYPLPAEVEDAFKHAKVLVVELDITKVDVGALTEQSIAEGVYPVGDSLEKHVSAETAALLKDFCQSHRFYWPLVAQMKPALALMTLEQLVTPGASLSTDLGIDRHFLVAARSDPGKRIFELETPQEQMRALLTLNDQDAEALFKGIVSVNNKETLGQLVDCWMTGDAARMDKIVHASDGEESSRKYTERLIDERNVRMTDKIRTLLKGKEKIFVVVGAAHLVGDAGIVSQLAKDGLKVEQPVVTRPAPTTEH